MDVKKFYREKSERARAAITGERRGKRSGPVAKTVQLRADLQAIFELYKMQLTVRQVYYIAVVSGLLKKTKADYVKVMSNLGTMREDGVLPWDWVADNTRMVHKLPTWDDPEEILRAVTANYRRNFWQDQPIRVEIWCESDSVASFIRSAADRYAMPLSACRGQASKTFVYESATELKRIGKPVHVIYVGDWDPTGLAIDRAVEERLDRYVEGEVEITLERIAITPEQARLLAPTGTPAKRSDVNYARFKEECDLHGLDYLAVEAEALDPGELRSLVDAAVERFVDHDAWETHLEQQATDIEELRELIDA